MLQLTCTYIYIEESKSKPCMFSVARKIPHYEIQDTISGKYGTIIAGSMKGLRIRQPSCIHQFYFTNNQALHFPNLFQSGRKSLSTCFFLDLQGSLDSQFLWVYYFGNAFLPPPLTYRFMPNCCIIYRRNIVHTKGVFLPPQNRP